MRHFGTKFDFNMAIFLVELDLCIHIHEQKVEQANKYEEQEQWQTFLGIEGTEQKCLGSRELELKTYWNK